MRRLLALLVANLALAWRFLRRSILLAVLVGVLIGVIIVIVSLTSKTYYVDPDGDGDKCRWLFPCSLTTAVAQVNAGTIVGGSTVHLKSGRYGQAALTISGSGTAEQPIVWRFDDGVAGDDDDAYLSGCREAIAPSAWTLVPGTTATYRADFDNETKGWTPTTILQCRQTTFAPITARQNADSLNAHPLDFPPSYKNTLRSAGDVDAQGGNFWFNDATNEVLVHAYDDLAPASHHDFYFRSAGWGHVNVTGAHHVFLGPRMEYANSGGYGMRLNASSHHVAIRHGWWQSATLNLLGDDLEVSDTTAESVTSQGDLPDVDCFNANEGAYGAGTSRGLCFNRRGDGTAISVGYGASSILLQRLTLRNNWNSLAIDPQDGDASGITGIQLLDSNLSGSLNHCLGMHGVGHRIVGNIVDNCQESFFQNQDTGDLRDTEIANNMFNRGALLESIRNRGLRIHRNIFTVLRINGDPTGYIEIDCNLYIPTPTGTNDDIATSINPSQDFETLDELRAATTWETNGAQLPFTSWQDGSQFKSYSTTPRVLGFVPDFHPATPAAQAVNMPEICGRVGPYDYAETR